MNDHELPAPRPRVLLSTVSSDAHTWNLVYLQLLLEEHGYAVLNLGPCVPDELLLATARRERPDAIVISSVNGHGHHDGARVVRALRRDPVTSTVPVMIGGRLGITGTGERAHIDTLLEAGCDFVFTESSDTPSMIAELGRVTARSVGSTGAGGAA